MPVTKSELKLDPKSQSRRNQATAYYAVPLSVVKKEGAQDPDKLYSKIGVLLTDSSGTRLKQEGALPESLLGLGARAGGESRLAQAFKAAGIDFKDNPKETRRERHMRSVHEASILMVEAPASFYRIAEAAAEPPEEFPWAQESLGKAYLYGRADQGGPGIDYEKAFRLLHKAAQAGLTSAQFDLFTMYAKGLGVPSPDAKEAMYWLEKAAAGGHSEAKKRLEMIKERRVPASKE
jgi:TPR repeat protein